MTLQTPLDQIPDGLRPSVNRLTLRPVVNLLEQRRRQAQSDESAGADVRRPPPFSFNNIR